ncbi:MAG: flagellar biosynthesis protein FlhF [bacterium]|nr:flagellar biosynthesis protein FlhF [bacterium]
MLKYKTYTAPTLQRAILQMTIDLGKDALLVSHRNVSKGGIFGIFGKRMVEVTAALPIETKPKIEKKQTPPVVSQPIQPLPQIPVQEQREPVLVQSYSEMRQPILTKEAQPVLLQEAGVMSMIQRELAEIKEKMQAISEEKGSVYRRFPGKCSELYLRLIENEVERDLAESIIKRIVVETPPNLLEDEPFVESRVIKYIATMIKTDGSIQMEKDGPKIISLIGPTGVGKTTTLAKIATEYAFEKHKKVAVITVDTYRIAAAEQLKTYTEILGIPLCVIYFPSEFKKAIDQYAGSDIILIDTAGRSQRNSMQMAELKAFLDSAGYNLENLLLLSATTKYKELVDMVESFSRLNFQRIVFTKTDEAVTFGPILSLSYKVPHPILYLTTGQNVPEDIELADRDKIARMVIGA